MHVLQYVISGDPRSSLILNIKQNVHNLTELLDKLWHYWTLRMILINIQIQSDNIIWGCTAKCYIGISHNTATVTLYHQQVCMPEGNLIMANLCLIFKHTSAPRASCFTPIKSISRGIINPCRYPFNSKPRRR